MGRFRLEGIMPTLSPQQVEDAARFMPDRTLATSFLEPEARARVIAIILFAYEIGRARSVVSEAGLAAIRLQWWRDTIEQIYAGHVVRAQPTAIALAGAIQEANLPENLFIAMIDGHEREIETFPFVTWQDLNAYLDLTQGNLIRLSLLASGLPAITTHSDEAARQAGIATGLAHLLRVMPQWSQRRSMWLPMEACDKIDREAVFAGQVSQDLRTLLLSVIEKVSHARERANKSLRHGRIGLHFPALALACLAFRYAKLAIPKSGTSLHVAQDVTLLERQIRITMSIATGKI